MSNAPTLGDETVINDDENPRNVRFSGMIIEYLAIEPRVEVSEIGDLATRPDSREARITALVRNLTDEPAVAEVRWGGLGIDRSEMIAPGQRVEISRMLSPIDLPYGETISVSPLVENEVAGHVTDTATLHEDSAFRVALLVDVDTMIAGDERFGSFVRRMRKSFEDLHALFDDVEATTASGMFEREQVRDRFRIDHVETYDSSRDERPKLFDEHPQFDLVIACDEGGPLCCFWLPAYSIGHNFTHEPESLGLWSRWGEQALWHEMIHFRGVPDYSIYRVPAASLPGRARGDLELPAAYRMDLLNSPYQAPAISALSAKVINFKHAVARVGACEEPEQPYGHMWRWLPSRLRIHVDEGGRPLSTARVRWWRSAPAGLPDARMQGVAFERVPDGADTLNRLGEVTLMEDYIGASEDREKRSLWLLFEIIRDGEVRFGVISGLWLNEAFADGQTDLATWWCDWEALHVPAAARAVRPEGGG